MSDRQGAFLEVTTPIGVFADSTLLVRSTRFEPRAAVPCVFRPRFIVARHNARGQLMDSLLNFQGDESYQEPRPRGGQLSMRRAFGVQTGLAVGARGFAQDWVVRFGGVTSKAMTWVVFDEDGRQVRAVRVHEEMDVLDAHGPSVLVRVWDGDGTEGIQVRELAAPPA